MALIVGNNASLRSKWTFKYTAATLAEAAKKKAEFREGRVKWWSDKLEQVISEIKNKGLKISRGVGADASKFSMANYSSTVRGARLVVEDHYQDDLDLCESRVNLHTVAALQYRGWEAMLNDQNRSDQLELTHEDWLYFFADEQLVNDENDNDE